MNSVELLLKHADVPYDPAKRREYYLKTRELKGRQPGRGSPTASKTGNRARSQGDLTKRRAASEQRREEVKARIEKLKAHIAELKVVLKKVLAEAKARGGGTPQPAKKTAAKSDSKSSDKKPLTAKQKSDAAKRSKEAYDKEQKKSGNQNQELASLTNQLNSLKKRISKAIENARSNQPSRTEERSSSNRTAKLERTKRPSKQL
jgi:uncharacterized protein YceH (UPF0502 family)